MTNETITFPDDPLHESHQWQVLSKHHILDMNTLGEEAQVRPKEKVIQAMRIDQFGDMREYMVN